MRGRYRQMARVLAIAALLTVAAPVVDAAAAGRPAGAVPASTGTLTVSRTNGGTTVGGTSCFTAYSGATLVDSECDDSGTVTFTLPAASYTVVASADESFQDNRVHGVVVAAGHHTTLMIDVQLWGELILPVQDRSGEGVASACGYARPITVDGAFSPWTRTVCADDDGNLLLDRLPAGAYQVFIDPADGVDGAQWVGPHGGVGRQELAATFTIAAGATDFASPVTVDPAGTITGHVTDSLTGHPVTDAVVSVVPNAKTTSGAYQTGVAVDASGAFRVTGLGPYQWPLEVVSDSHAWQWGHGPGNRFTNGSVTVTAGHTTTADRQVSAGGELTGTVLSHGHPVAGAWVFVENARTSDDAAAWVQTDASGHFTVAHVLAQTVRVGVPLGIFPDLTWYQNAASFGTATKVAVTDGATTSITIQIPGTEPAL